MIRRLASKAEIDLFDKASTYIRDLEADATAQGHRPWDDIEIEEVGRVWWGVNSKGKAIVVVDDTPALALSGPRRVELVAKLKEAIDA